MNSQKISDESTFTCKLLESSGLAPTTVTKINDEFVINTFIKFLMELHIDVDEILNTIPENMLHPESFHETMKIINLESAMSTILQNVSYDGLNFHDLVSPKNKKFNKIIRYASNFLSYYKYTNAKMEEEEKKINQKRERIEALLVQQSEMEKKISDTIQLTDEKQKNCQKSKVQIEQIATRLAQKKKLRPELMKKLKEAREDHEKRNAELTNLKANLLEVQQMKTDLERKLVSSPSKIVAKSLKVDALKRQKEEEITALKKSKEAKNELFEKGEDASKNMSFLMEMIQECVQIKQKYRSTMETVENHRKTVEELKNKLEEAEKNKMNDENNKQQEDKELVDLKARCEVEVREISKKNEFLRSELGYVKEQVQAFEREKEELESAIQRDNNIAERLSTEIDHFMELAQQRYETEVLNVMKKQMELEKELDN